MSGQNRSSAVMQQRSEPHDSLDDFPTPPWATRALLERLPRQHLLGHMTAREPCANRGHMVKPLREVFDHVEGFDVHDYGAGFPVRDFLFPGFLGSVDWTIMNPPFRLAVEFIERALDTSLNGVAAIVRTSFLEGIDRYNRLYSVRPPTKVWHFAERVVMHKGKLAPKGSTATSYSWLVWDKFGQPEAPGWIGPCRRRLERETDYGPEDYL